MPPPHQLELFLIITPETGNLFVDSRYCAILCIDLDEKLILTAIVTEKLAPAVCDSEAVDRIVPRDRSAGSTRYEATSAAYSDVVVAFLKVLVLANGEFEGCQCDTSKDCQQNEETGAAVGDIGPHRSFVRFPAGSSIDKSNSG